MVRPTIPETHKQDFGQINSLNPEDIRLIINTIRRNAGYAKSRYLIQKLLNHLDELPHTHIHQPSVIGYIGKTKPNTYLLRKRRAAGGAFKSLASSPLSFQIKHHSFSLPLTLSHIQAAIQNSASILDLDDSWDDEGAVKVPDAVWLDAIEFLIGYSTAIFKNYHVVIAAPSILPCADGSVDLEWRANKARMLINFRNDSSKEAHYYGDRLSDSTQFKGTFPTHIYQEHIASWLKNLKL
ncbi:MAG: hypothetical protein EBX41_06095 [Chitinophagia bacterium]|nr:hypothetical protein [Chitinophagia bacterium]